MMDIRVERVVLTDTHALGVWRGFTVSVFDGVLGVPGLEVLHQQVMDFRGGNTQKTADLVVVHPTKAGMSNAERKKWLEIVKSTEHYRLAGATVVLAEGLLGSMHRGIITSFNLLAPPPHPARVFGNARDALEWMAPYIQQTCATCPVPQLEREIAAISDEIKAKQAH